MTNPQQPQPSVNDLKAAILGKLDVRGFYQRHLPTSDKISAELRSVTGDGWSNRVLCPIHKDTHTANFFVNLTSGAFRCQACGAGGSVFDFWLALKGLSKADKRNFKDALIGVATEAGIDIEHWRKDWVKTQKVSSGKNDKTGLPTSQTTAAKEEPAIPKMSKVDAADHARKAIPMEQVEELHKNLTRDHFVYLSKRGLTKKTIEAAKIGFDPEAMSKHRETQEWVKGRYALPVFNAKGECRNFRLYSSIASADYKMINYMVGKGTDKEESYGAPVRLYQLHRLKAKPYHNVIICEGEWDCLLLNQQLEDAGYETWAAVTGTHGANTFDAEWLENFWGLNVYFMYDCDPPGKLAAADHVSKHFVRCLDKFASVHIVELPLDGSKEMKDVSDYFLKHEGSCDDLVRMCTETPDIIAGGLSADDASQEAEKVSDLITAVKDRRYIDKRVEVPITISGTTSKIYHAIRSYAVTRCPLMEQHDGSCCSAENTERTIPYGHPLFIEACMEKERNLLTSIARMTCQKDERCSVSAMTKVVMEEFFANQVVERWKSQEDDNGRMQNAQELVQISVYILQPEVNIQIEPQNYIATGFIRTHPRTSIATLFIENMRPIEEDWKKFSLETSDNKMILENLRRDFTVEGIMEELTQGVTHIYKSDEILLTVLLNYLAPLWINFNGQMQRGWINAAIIGDSGTGKSKSYQRFADWIELGDLFSALSGTRTGLLYSIKKRADEWHVSIGRYVQASGRIIAVDETQQAQPEEIGRMAIAMDTGFLEVQQVASGGYHTQTRLILLLNPVDTNRKATTVSDFTFGCDALRHSFDPMFIRRLDVAIFTVGNLSHEFYNQPISSKPGEKFVMRLTPRMMKTLIYWAWTRKADQVHWTEAATALALKLATQMSEEYGYTDQIPLVNPQDFRLKLARMATAYAILDRNFTSDLLGVTVEEQHVQLIVAFLDKVYSSPACNLKQKSKAMRAKNHLDDYDRIKDAFESAIRVSRESSNEVRRRGDFFLRFLSTIHVMGRFRKRQVAEQLNVNLTWVTNRIMILQGYNLVEIATHGDFRTTRKFNLFMQTWKQNPEIEGLFSEIQNKIGRQALEQADSLEPFERAGGGDSSGGNYEPTVSQTAIQEFDPFQPGD